MHANTKPYAALSSPRYPRGNLRPYTVPVLSAAGDSASCLWRLWLDSRRVCAHDPLSQPCFDAAPYLCVVQFTLRYFACRGRGQSLRFLLADSGVAWNNIVVPMPSSSPANWSAAKADSSQSGPLGTVPSLEITGTDGGAAPKLPKLCNETLALAAYLGRTLPALTHRPLDDVAWLHSTTTLSA